MIQSVTLVFASGLIAMLLVYYSVSFNRVTLTQLERLFRLSDDQSKIHGIRSSTVVLSMNIAAMAAEVFFLYNLFNIFRVIGKAWSQLLLFVIIALTFEILTRLYIPSVIPVRYREKLRLSEILLVTMISFVFFPVAIALEFISIGTLHLFFPKSNNSRISDAEETIKSIIDVGEKEGIFKEEDGELLQSIVEFSETVVKEVMTPRIDLQCIEVSQPLSELVRIIIESGYSKIPVYRERIDNIEGILYAKDILKFWNNPRETLSLTEIIRPVYFIPETKKVRDLLREFQKEKMHLAIVVDEYGGVAGLVTIEDLLEEIVGEIHDEYDVEQELFRVVSNDSWVVDAKMDLDELEEELDMEFPRDNYETLGGFLFDQMGRIPMPGEIHVFNNLNIEILEANDRRIGKVAIHKLTEDTEKDTDPDKNDSE